MRVGLSELRAPSALRLDDDRVLLMMFRVDCGYFGISDLPASPSRRAREDTTWLEEQGFEVPRPVRRRGSRGRSRVSFHHRRQPGVPLQGPAR